MDRFLVFLVYLVLHIVAAEPFTTTPTVFFANDTAVSLSWEHLNENSVANIPRGFYVELATGGLCEDFLIFAFVPFTRAARFSNNSYSVQFTAVELLPDSQFNFRVIPVYSFGKGFPSGSVTVSTLKSSMNFWEPVLPRRLSLSSSGRGFGQPVLQRPHLDVGVEILDERTSLNPLRYSDAMTSQTPVLPSGRRGHSISTVGMALFLFGGRTTGYSCSSVYKDNINLGTTQSGRYVLPCTHKQGEVNELWTFDLSTYQWTFLNTSKWHSSSPPPPPREQHSALVVGGDLYIYGGKARFFEVDAMGVVNTGSFHNDVVYSDLWRLTVPRSLAYSLSRTAASAPIAIVQDAQVLSVLNGLSDPAIMAVSDPSDPRNSYCIQKVVVTVTVRHPCVGQLSVSLLGPGAVSGSPNMFASTYDNEVLLFRSLPTAALGCVGGTFTFVLNDDFTRVPEKCCVDPAEVSGDYRPQGKLSEFAGTSMASNWTLKLLDLQEDTLDGVLLDWSISFSSAPCFNSFEWIQLPGSTASPGGVARYSALAVTYNSFIFVYGGRDGADNPLVDLHRFDTSTGLWQALQPVNFDGAFQTSSSVNSNFLLTSWGLLRFGGYYRQPSMLYAARGGDLLAYDNSVYLCDPVTMRWSAVTVAANPHNDTTFGSRLPAGRYLAAAAFVSSAALHWAPTSAAAFTHRALYDAPIKSTRANYQGVIADSVVLLGGFDGSSGNVFDGSSGGFFNDMWMLRLGSFSTDGARNQQQSYKETHCAWRGGVSALQTAGTSDCIVAPGTAGSAPNCELRDLLLLAWCSALNQTVA